MFSIVVLLAQYGLILVGALILRCFCNRLPPF